MPLAPGTRLGPYEIVAPFDGGVDPVWSGDGRELFFRAPGGDVIEVADMARGPALAVRRVVFRAATGRGTR